MSDESYCLEGRGLTHSFGQGTARTTVLRDANMGLVKGQIILVMGPSGSGKSTLLALLAGLMRPETGHIVALGVDMWQLTPKARKQFRQRHFGFIFQGYNLFPALNARQQLEIVLRWGEGASARDASRRADEMLARLGLKGKETLRPMQLSGGEKQRVAIARALVKLPALIFADEPTSALDWKHGQQVIEMLRSAAKAQGTAVFIVTHDPRIVKYADLVYHLEEGRLRTTRPAEDHASDAHEHAPMEQGQALCSVS